MASLSLFPRFASLPRWHDRFCIDPSRTLVLLRDGCPRLCRWRLLAAVSRGEVLEEGIQDVEVTKKRNSKSSKRSTARTRKKAATGDVEEEKASRLVLSDEDTDFSASFEDSIPKTRRGRKKGTASTLITKEETPKKSRGRRKTKFKEDDDDVEDNVV